MRVRNNRANATNPGHGGSWKPGEERDLPDDIGKPIADMAGFMAVEPVTAPPKAKPKAKKSKAKGGKK